MSKNEFEPVGIVCVADTHFHVDPAENKILEERITALMTKYPTSALAIAGDITDNGKVEEYREAFRVLTPWKGRLFLAQGNHDFGFQGLTWEPEAVKRWNQLCVALGVQDVDCIIKSTTGAPWWLCVIDSTIAEESILNLAQGEVGGAEMNRASHAIKMAHRLGIRVALLMHHTPVDSIRQSSRSLWEEIENGFQDWAEKLRDSSAFLKVAYGKADCIVAGHTHRNNAWTSTPESGSTTTLLRSLGDLRTKDADWMDSAVLVLV